VREVRSVSQDYDPQYGHFRITGNEHWVDASANYETEEERDQVLALFPKWVKAKGSRLSYYTGSMKTNDFTSHSCPTIVFHADLRATGVSGKVNETGLKRYRRFREVLARQDFPRGWHQPYSNSLSEDEFHEAHGI